MLFFRRCCIPSEVECENHISVLRKAIEENEQSLAQMKTVLAQMEGYIRDSQCRHSTSQDGRESERFCDEER